VSQELEEGEPDLRCGLAEFNFNIDFRQMVRRRGELPGSNRPCETHSESPLEKPGGLSRIGEGMLTGPPKTYSVNFSGTHFDRGTALPRTLCEPELPPGTGLFREAGLLEAGLLDRAGDLPRAGLRPLGLLAGFFLHIEVCQHSVGCAMCTTRRAHPTGPINDSTIYAGFFTTLIAKGGRGG